MKIGKYSMLFKMMNKIGLIGFGGGSALIPVIEAETVDKKKVMSKDEYDDNVVVASFTPGALPVEIATGIGQKVAGSLGMIVSATAISLPGAILTVAMLMLISLFQNEIQTQIGFIAFGINCLIIVTLCKYIKETVSNGKNIRESLLYLSIVFCVFVVTGEKALYKILTIQKDPFFGLSTLQVLYISFFVILFTKGKLRDLNRLIPALLISAIYVISLYDWNRYVSYLNRIVLILMIILSIEGFVRAFEENNKKKKIDIKEIRKDVICWLLFVVILSVPAFIFIPEVFEFIGDGFLSSLLSFGGGDAYLTTAHGIFVDGDIISNDDFYGSIVAVVNTLPGSILCKTLTGIGYVFGYGQNGIIWQGILVAVCGYGVSVAASGLIFQLVFVLYRKYEKMPIFQSLKHFIRPIISGLLINVVLSLANVAVKESSQSGFESYITALLFAIMLGINLFMEKKSVHLFKRILLCGGVSGMIFNLI